MSPKILLADDSATIQKVIKITLANENCELMDAPSESALLDLTAEHKPQLVLLDFGLSEDKSGYELAKMIKQSSPQTAVLMMFGTFDTVDEGALKSASVEDKIVKPFDSAKFVNLCRSLLFNGPQSPEEVEVVEIDFSKKEQTSSASQELAENIEDTEEQSLGEEQWIVNEGNKELDSFSQSTTPLNEEDKTKEITPANLLDNEVLDWGMSVPPRMGREKSEEAQDDNLELSIPEIISSHESLYESEVTANEEKFPEQNDLDFPDPQTVRAAVSSSDNGQGETFGEDETGSGPEKLQNIKLTSKLISLDELKLDSSEVQNQAHDLEQAQNIDELKSVVEEERTNDDFWAVDEVDDGIKNEKNQVIESDLIAPASVSLEELKKEEIAIEEGIPLQEHSPAESSSYNDFQYAKNVSVEDAALDLKEEIKEAVKKELLTQEELKTRIEQELRPVIQQLVREYCKETIEKVAWEVIPDLAENLIKSEIERISNSITSE